ncbi:phosphate signaling complex protein PhoU [Hydrogenophaga sp. YM1]|jgi:phosphate transport system protein|uniref:Phosphate-specific transport system accessory protein PhoU n=1 Tax=Hydrogenophaga borbori TaxID=2294117 RepID=A0A372EN03_9BURK|nr:MULTISPECIES: phosphate signaling complex protein PhoU [Hydrogenophaga]NCT99580.1 phosphate signaling complex protein PhoU [Comamonadaceae bacterium]ODT32744.1 MAG: phosphate transport system regulatory protein PhoU [Hydrogenophaga sp. SCN 70-13]MBN9371237.1 phosphate signaling complex protein PhoU [Hydrogenophaga sp.]OJV55215.1 MAG: phosphate transport system regulatory protein PhoU [Hydrogenophaga sp. 70-12]QRR36060.1 phosphate signaling complex protein PhoU [Hydrogenophaga sp. YM1]
MSDKHLSSQFDAELNSISTHVLEMGGLVESQLHQAVYALGNMSLESALQVEENENRINQMELSIDHEIISTIGRRQPTARDLRFLMAISRTTQNLERAGDEVARMARMVKSIIGNGTPRNLPISELRLAADLAAALLRKSLDSFARLDTQMAVSIIKADDQIDEEYNGFLRKLITYMMEDPRTISPSLDLLFLAKSIERIGDHAKNIAEQIIFIVKGEDVRHTPVDKVESVAG